MASAIGRAYDKIAGKEFLNSLLDKTREAYEFGLLVWDTVISVFRRDPQNELDELDLSVVQDEP